MNKFIKLGVSLLLTVCMLAGCSMGGLESAGDDKEEYKPVTITVTTMYAGNDGNAQNFKDVVTLWEAETGNKILDNSVTSDEAFKSRVLMDYRTGAEPDVLFYFNGVDSNPLVANNRVVSLEEICSVYPEYAANMKKDLMQASPYDGKIYCIPVNGYWEGLFVNKKVCEAAGVRIPDADTDWDEFMDICDKIRDAGYTPIAASLASVPHYWFEFCIYNYQSPETHAVLPKSVDDSAGQAWVKGLTMIKTMYERGYFPENTLSASDDDTMRKFFDGEAAFLLDGSWRMSGVEQMADNVEDFTVTFVPGMGERRSTDIISGLSCGYYLSRKAWEDPEKREAAVSFIEYITADEVVSKFAEVSATALINGVTIDESDLSCLAKDALAMNEKVTGTSSAVQDDVPVDCRVPVFEGMPALVKGEKDITEAVEEVLKLIAAKEAE